jgi:hypothetical protein
MLIVRLRQPRSRAAIAVLTTALIVLLALVVSGKALAATRSSATPHAKTHKSVRFKESWTFKSKPIGVCVAFELTGRIKYNAVTNGHSSVFWTDQTLSLPTIFAKVHAYKHGRCTDRRATVTKMDMGQYWTGYSCSFNPSLSVSLPWGISFGGWPSCGSRNRAEHHTSYGRGASFTQNNTGSPTAFGNYTGTAQSPPCYGVFIGSTIYHHNTSDSFESSAKKVCLPAS